MLSQNDWRMRRQRPAPNAARTAISRVRPEARASIRPAMLEQAMSNTNPTAPSSTSMGLRVSPAMKSVNGSRNMPQAESLAYAPPRVPLAFTRSLSTPTKALAEANGAAGRSRATA
jgi:hypothetical protein